MRSHRFTLVDLVFSVSLLALGLVLLTPSTLRARATSRQLACTDHFRHIGLALQNYESTHATFPPGRIWEPDPTRPVHDNGLPLMIIPYLEQSGVYNTFNFHMSWITPQNHTTRIQMLEVLLCPDDPPASVTAKVDPVGTPTNVMFSLGSLTWMTHPVHPSARLGPNPEGIFYDNSRVGVRDITDGTAVTVMASEQLIDMARRDGSAEMTGECSGTTGEGKQYYERSGTRWVAGHPSNNYFNARRTPNHADPDCFHGTPVGIGSLNKVPRSRHEGGVNVLIADGSVRFMRNTIDLKVWQALNTRAGNEQVDASQF